MGSRINILFKSPIFGVSGYIPFDRIDEGSSFEIRGIHKTVDYPNKRGVKIDGKNR